MWKECTQNEWTVSTPVLSIDVGVIGPFEEGFLREEASRGRGRVRVSVRASCARRRATAP